MKRLALLIGLLAALAVPAAAQAHPLGNFTVNRYSAIEASGDRVYVKYVLDLAEIPTYQEGDRVRRQGFAKEIARGLDARGRRATGGTERPRVPRSLPARRGRPRNAPLRGRLRGRSGRNRDSLPGHELRGPRRLARSRRPRRPRRPHPFLRRSRDQRQRRAPRVSGRPALGAARRLVGAGRASAGLASGPATRARRRGAPRHERTTGSRA